VFIEPQHWTRPLQERLWLLDMLPGMEPPGTDLLSSQPTANGSRRDLWQARSGSDVAGEFGSTPMRERNSMRARQATRQSRHLGPNLGGKPAWRTWSGSICEHIRLVPTSPPLPHPTLMAAQRTSHVLGAPVWVGMRGQDQVRTASDRLRGSMSLDQKLQVMEFMRSQLKRTLMMHETPP